MDQERIAICTQGGYELRLRPDALLTALNEELKPVNVLARTVRVGQIVPLPLADVSRMVAREVPLPALDQCYYAGDPDVKVPDLVSPALAEVVGYFMGDGSLHAKGIRLCVANTDPDVVERLADHGRQLFGLSAIMTAAEGYWDVSYQSVRLARWWDAVGFAKVRPHSTHVGKGWTPHLPAALRESNDRHVLAAFIRGLFEADGSVTGGVPSLATTSQALANEMRSLLLSFGCLSTSRITTSGYGSRVQVIRLRNRDHAARFKQTFGLMSRRKDGLIATTESRQPGNRDRIYLRRGVWEDVLPTNTRLRRLVISSLAKGGGVSRRTAEAVRDAYPDVRVQRALAFGYEPVVAIG